MGNQVVIDASSVWQANDAVLFKSQWGWDPNDWGFLAFSDKTRRDNLGKALQSPFIGLIYVTDRVRDELKDQAGKICGFYVVSDQTCNRADYARPSDAPDANADRWLHGFRPYSAFSFLPKDRPLAREFFPEFNASNTWRSIGHHGRLLAAGDPKLNILRALKVQEVPLYRPWGEMPSATIQPRKCLPWTKAGPDRKNGYWVEPADLNIKRHLYMLRLCGDERNFLKPPANDRWIIKIGLSYDPDLRLASLAWHLPEGQFTWKRIHPDEAQLGPALYEFDAAKHGEDTMKKFLGSIPDSHLGNEFYAATAAQVTEAWHLGTQAACNFKVRG